MYGITKDDVGFVGFKSDFDHTQRYLDGYAVIDGPVSAQQAIEVLDFDIEKRPNFGMDNDGGMRELDGSFHLCRPDTDTVLVQNVGNKFTVCNNGQFFKYINESILAIYPQLQIESVGTLYGGATTFINLKVNEFFIKGDDSPNVNRLMYYNPLGKGSYGCGAHSIRLWCANTLNASKAEAKANGSMFKFRHTKNAQNAINGHLTELADTFLELDRYVEDLGILAKTDMSSSTVDAFLETLYPTISNSKKSETTNINKQGVIRNVFETVQGGLTRDISRSAYAMLNAVTGVIDHPEKLRKDTDIATNVWDGLIGLKADFKTRAFNSLLAIAA